MTIIDLLKWKWNYRFRHSSKEAKSRIKSREQERKLAAGQSAETGSGKPETSI